MYLFFIAMNFINPTHSDCIIILNVINLVYPNTRQPKYFDCKVTQYIPYTQAYMQLYRPCNSTLQKSLFSIIHITYSPSLIVKSLLQKKNQPQEHQHPQGRLFYPLQVARCS